MGGHSLFIRKIIELFMHLYLYLSWGAIVNDSRTFARLIISLVRDKEFSVSVSFYKERLVKRQIAWCYSLGYSLRKQDALTPIKHLLHKDDLSIIEKHDNIPNALLQLDEPKQPVVEENTFYIM